MTSNFAFCQFIKFQTIKFMNVCYTMVCPIVSDAFGYLKTQNPGENPEYFGTRTREMVSEPDPNPSIVMYYSLGKPKPEENPTFWYPNPTQTWKMGPEPDLNPAFAT